MTHDEMLARVDDLAVHNAGYGAISEALRAVVTVCRDYTGAYPNASEEFENGLTIAFAIVMKAIEKELG